MRTPLLSRVLSGVVVAVLAATLAPAGLAESQVFINANIITLGDAGVVRGEMFVRDGRIAAVAPRVERPADARVIDAAGAWLIPGLAEMHAHVPAPGQGATYRDDVLFLWAAFGITTARGMLGHPDHLALRQALEDHQVFGPRLYTSGPSFNGNSVDSPDQARAMVAAQHQAGYDFLKIHPGLTRAEYDAMAAEANRLGIPFAGHVPVEVGLERALSAGQLTIDHADGYLQYLVPGLQADDPGQQSFFGAALIDRAQVSRISDAVALTLDAGAWVVPTETLFENIAAADQVEALLARPDAAYLPAELKSGYVRALEGAAASVDAAQRYLSLRKRLLADLHRAGVPLLLGSDSPQIFNVPGWSIHRELQAMVDAGLTPEEALRTGTVNPARFFGGNFGVLEPGLAADVVMLGGNPLQAIAHTMDIRGVMVRGHWLDAAERERRLEEVAARYAP